MAAPPLIGLGDAPWRSSDERAGTAEMLAVTSIHSFRPIDGKNDGPA